MVLESANRNVEGMQLQTRSEGKKAEEDAEATEEEGKRKHHLSRQVQDAALDSLELPRLPP